MWAAGRGGWAWAVQLRGGLLGAARQGARCAQRRARTQQRAQRRSPAPPLPLPPRVDGPWCGPHLQRRLCIVPRGRSKPEASSAGPPRCECRGAAAEPSSVPKGRGSSQPTPLRQHLAVQARWRAAAAFLCSLLPRDEHTGPEAPLKRARRPGYDWRRAAAGAKGGSGARRQPWPPAHPPQWAFRGRGQGRPPPPPQGLQSLYAASNRPAYIHCLSKGRRGVPGARSGARGLTTLDQQDKLNLLLSTTADNRKNSASQAPVAAGLAPGTAAPAAAGAAASSGPEPPTGMRRPSPHATADGAAKPMQRPRCRRRRAPPWRRPPGQRRRRAAAAHRCSWPLVSARGGNRL